MVSKISTAYDESKTKKISNAYSLLYMDFARYLALFSRLVVKQILVGLDISLLVHASLYANSLFFANTNEAGVHIRHRIYKLTLR